jgi:cobalt-zinc-cadmium efflux system membrane fusion protein
MTTEATTATPHDPAPPQKPRGARYWMGRAWAMGQFLVALAAAGAALAYLLLHPAAHVPEDDSANRPAPPVEIVGPKLLRLRPDSTLDKRYQTATVSERSLRSPVVMVTGTVVASMRHGEKGKPDFWQFNAPETLTAYADWQKAIKDVTFYTEQLEKRHKANRAIEAAQRGVVKRKKDLLIAGTETKEAVALAEADLQKLELTNEKEVHEAEKAILDAVRSEAALARQLQQAGLDTDLLRQADRDLDVIMADVPEARFGQIKVGQQCEAKFFSLPGEVFSGRVRSIASVVSKERRTLRVLFQVKDPKDQLRPGMFAEIGLGTDERKALLMPVDGVVHVGKDDYALLDAGQRSWRVARVKLGELYGEEVEVTEGLKDGDRVMASGAILMKQFIIRATQPDAAPQAQGAANNGGAPRDR